MLKLENFRESIPYMIKTIEELKTRDFLDISDKCDKLIEILNEAKKDKTFDIIEPLNFREVEHSDYNLKRIINIIKSFRR